MKKIHLIYAACLLVGYGGLCCKCAKTGEG